LLSRKKKRQRWCERGAYLEMAKRPLGRIGVDGESFWSGGDLFFFEKGVGEIF
jgi:hypothetical protein